MITITLYWWMIPIAVFLCGIALSLFSEKQVGGWDLDPLPGFILFASMIAALAMVAGHFL